MQNMNNQTPDPTLSETDAAASSDAESAAGQAETMPSLEEMLKVAELKAEEHHDAWLRAKAEGENIRRRAQDDIAKAGKFAAERFAGELLAVKDSLEAALATTEQDTAALRSGVELIVKQMEDILRQLQVNTIPTIGEAFDPRVHEAMGSVERLDLPDQHVAEEIRRGYKLRERLLRPAMVRVVSNPKQTGE